LRLNGSRVVLFHYCQRLIFKLRYYSLYTY